MLSLLTIYKRSASPRNDAWTVILFTEISYRCLSKIITLLYIFRIYCSSPDHAKIDLPCVCQDNRKLRQDYMPRLLKFHDTELVYVLGRNKSTRCRHSLSDLILFYSMSEFYLSLLGVPAQRRRVATCNYTMTKLFNESARRTNQIYTVYIREILQYESSSLRNLLLILPAVTSAELRMQRRQR